MVTRYRSHDTEDVCVIQDSPFLDLASEEPPMLEGDNGLSDEYREEAGTHHLLAKLLEQFHQLKDKFAS